MLFALRVLGLLIDVNCRLCVVALFAYFGGLFSMFVCLLFWVICCLLCLFCTLFVAMDVGWFDIEFRFDLGAGVLLI